MEQQIDLKQLERKVWMSFFEDGVWDIYLGMLLMAMAVGALLSDIGAPEATFIITYGCLIGTAFVLLWLGKRFITIPRLGLVHFGPKAKARKKKASIIFAVSVLVGFVVFLMFLPTIKGSLFTTIPVDLVFPVIWVANMLIVFSLAAYFLRFHRLYLIGVMFAVCIPLDILLKELTNRDLSFIAFGLPALVILIMGGVVLARFLSKYALGAEVTLDED